MLSINLPKNFRQIIPYPVPRPQVAIPPLNGHDHPHHVRVISWMKDLGEGALSLEEFSMILPTFLKRCNLRNMKMCEPVKRLLG